MAALSALPSSAALYDRKSVPTLLGSVTALHVLTALQCAEKSFFLVCYTETHRLV